MCVVHISNEFHRNVYFVHKNFHEGQVLRQLQRRRPVRGLGGATGGSVGRVRSRSGTLADLARALEAMPAAHRPAGGRRAGGAPSSRRARMRGATKTTTRPSLAHLFRTLGKRFRKHDADIVRELTGVV